MTQSKPTFDKHVMRHASWGAYLLTAAALAFFGFAVSAVSFTDWEDYVLVGFPLVMAAASLSSIYLMRRGRMALATGLVFSLNLLVPLILTIFVADTFLPALVYAVISSTLLIWRTMSQPSQRWSISVTVLTVVVIGIVNIINPPSRFVLPPEFNGFITFVIATLTVSFIFQAVTEAWNRSYTIGRKLLIAFGVLGLLSLAVGLLANFGLSNVTNAYDHALEDGGKLRVISLSLSKDLSTARRHEDDFLLRWTEEGFNNAYTNYALANQETVVEMRRGIASMFDFAVVVGETFSDTYPQTEYSRDLNTLRESVDTYERNFQKVVQLIKEKGFQDEGLEGELRDAAHQIEDRIYDQIGLKDMIITMLQIRRHEKDYLLRGDQTYVDQTHEAVAELKQQISTNELLSLSERAQMRTLADQYIVAFDALVENDFEIAVATQEFNFAADTMEPIVEKLANTGAEMSQIGISTATTANVQMRTLTTIAMVVALLAAAFISLFLSRQISGPVVELTNTAQMIAGGQFDVHANVTSADEIGTLAQTFNTMTERLGAAFEDVRRRGLQVQTAAEVSRRLSAVTDPHQLAVEVVEQVQRAFNYYYAQIYLLDEAGENLVIAGGTGEAGASMLARRHSVPKGRGLVGRAADTNTSVLVPDVSQEEGWLPNDMLPETRTEAAVPISFGGQVYGVLDVQHSEVNGLTVDDVTLLESLAGQAAISLQNARSYEQSRRQAEFESLTNVIGQRIQRATSIEETLQTAIRELGTAIGASRVKANIQPASKAVSTNPVATD